MVRHPGPSLVSSPTPGLLIGWDIMRIILWCKWLVITTNNDLNFLVPQIFVFNSRQFSPQILRSSENSRNCRGFAPNLSNYFLPAITKSSILEGALIITLYCRGVAVSQLDGSPRVEGDPLQVCVHPRDWRPEVLLLLPLRDPGHGPGVRHSHRRPLPGREAGGLRGVQGDHPHIIRSIRVILF